MPLSERNVDPFKESQIYQADLVPRSGESIGARVGQLLD